MIEAVIFDMDGVLIDSEPLWQEAEIEVFGRVGLRLDRRMCVQTMGLRIDEAVAYWYARHPWESVPVREVEACIVDRVVELILAKGEPKEGAAGALDFFARLGVRTALASSSSYRIMRAVLARLGLDGRFGLLHSAEEEGYGKPHPGVYLTTARKLGVAPLACLAVEDSLNGVIAAKAARMKCVAIPDASARGDQRFSIADLILHSLAGLDRDVWDGLNQS